MAPKYEAYIGRPKIERREIVSNSGSLERKRFLLSTNPELKKRLKELHEAFCDFQKEHPEVISLGLFGSQVKGYASPESDIDGYLFVDEDILKDINRTRKHQEKVYQADIIKQFRAALMKRLFLGEEQLSHIFVKEVTLKDLNLRIKAGFPSFVTTTLFLLSLGDRVNKYRKAVLDGCSSRGAYGERYWKDVIDELAIFDLKMWV